MNSSMLKVYVEKEKKAFPIAIPSVLLRLLRGNNTGVAMEEERVLGALENHRLNLASFRQAYCSGHLLVWCIVSGNSLALPVLGAAWKLCDWVCVAQSPD